MVAKSPPDGYTLMATTSAFTIAKSAQTPYLKERYAGLGLEPISNTPEQCAEYVRREIARWRKVVAAATLKPQ